MGDAKVVFVEQRCHKRAVQRAEVYVGILVLYHELIDVQDYLSPNVPSGLMPRPVLKSGNFN